MLGNVLEYCYDWYNKDYYKSSPSENPQGPNASAQAARVTRGAAFANYVNQCRPAFRFEADPDQQNVCGFRCAVSVEK
jgi:formylglycine-generating enzyme required for sulfatase activity